MLACEMTARCNAKWEHGRAGKGSVSLLSQDPPAQGKPGPGSGVWDPAGAGACVSRLPGQPSMTDEDRRLSSPAELHV